MIGCDVSDHVTHGSHNKMTLARPWLGKQRTSNGDQLY